MPDADALYRSRRYKEALARAKKDAARDPRDYYTFGSGLTIGQSLLMLGRYQTAQKQLEDLTNDKHRGALYGPHFTYAGLANWFGGRQARAVEIWEAGLKAGYQAQDGMEIRWVLMYAAARNPKSYSRDKARQLIEQRAKRIYQRSGEYFTSQFILKQQSYEQVLENLAAAYTGQFQAQIVRGYRNLLDFFAGVHSLFDDDARRFYEQMLACAATADRETDTAELAIAECEIRHGPIKWKRRLSIQLRRGPAAGAARRALRRR
jgi:hypothetical protein